MQRFASSESGERIDLHQSRRRSACEQEGGALAAGVEDVRAHAAIGKVTAVASRLSLGRIAEADLAEIACSETPGMDEEGRRRLVAASSGAAAFDASVSVAARPVPHGPECYCI
jgi:hypothetical protein